MLINSWSSGRRICADAEHENNGRLYDDGDTAGVEYNTRQVAGSDEFQVYGGFQDNNCQVVDAVKSKTLPPTRFGDMLKTMEVAAIILAQALL